MDQQQQVNETAFQLLQELLDGKTTPDELELSQATQGDQFQESTYGQAIQVAFDMYNA